MDYHPIQRGVAMLGAAQEPELTTETCELSYLNFKGCAFTFLDRIISA